MLNCKKLFLFGFGAIFLAGFSFLVWQASNNPPPHRTPYAQQNAATDQATSQEGEKLSIDRSIARYTLWLAAFTLILAISTIGLWVTAIWGSRRQSTDTKQIADIAEKQLAISVAQTDIQKKQHAVGRLQFFATHRPEIIIHSIEFKRIPGKDEYDCIGASILCFNKGPTLAENVEIRGEIMATVMPEIDVQRPIVKFFAGVASGQKLRFDIKSEWQVRELAIRIRQHREKGGVGAPFCCVGTIVYFDQNRVVDEPVSRRETGFCFKLIMSTNGER
jgi:hypothetical protein